MGSMISCVQRWSSSVMVHYISQWNLKTEWCIFSFHGSVLVENLWPTWSRVFGLQPWYSCVYAKDCWPFGRSCWGGTWRSHLFEYPQQPAPRVCVHFVCASSCSFAFAYELLMNLSIAWLRSGRPLGLCWSVNKRFQRKSMWCFHSLCVYYDAAHDLMNLMFSLLTGLELKMILELMLWWWRPWIRWRRALARLLWRMMPMACPLSRKNWTRSTKSKKTLPIQQKVLFFPYKGWFIYSLRSG